MCYCVCCCRRCVSVCADGLMLSCACEGQRKTFWILSFHHGPWASNSSYQARVLPTKPSHQTRCVHQACLSGTALPPTCSCKTFIIRCYLGTESPGLEGVRILKFIYNVQLFVCSICKVPLLHCHVPGHLCFFF